MVKCPKCYKLTEMIDYRCQYCNEKIGISKEEFEEKFGDTPDNLMNDMKKKEQLRKYFRIIMICIVVIAGVYFAILSR